MFNLWEELLNRTSLKFFKTTAKTAHQQNCTAAALHFTGAAYLVVPQE